MSSYSPVTRPPPCDAPCKHLAFCSREQRVCRAWCSWVTAGGGPRLKDQWHWQIPLDRRESAYRLAKLDREEMQKK